MTQTVAATCVLGPGLTGLTIGLRVLNLDGSEYAAFSTTGVSETSVAGTYRKAGGVSVPDAGAYIVWGTAVTDYAEATVDAVVTAGTIADAVLDEAAAGHTGLLAVALPNVAAGAIGGLPLSKDASGRVEVASATDRNTLDALLTALQGADGDTLKDLSDEIAAIGSGSGSGTGTYTDTVTDGTNPLDGVRVQLSTDSAKANPVYQAYTDALGVFLMYPDPGTYYVWFEKAGYDFSAVNGTEVTVT